MSDITPVLLPGVYRHRRKYVVYGPGGKRGKKSYHGSHSCPLEANRISLRVRARAPVAA